MSSFSSCPKCAKPITVPRGAEPADMVRCPLCQSEYMLAEALANAPPELLVLRSLGVVSREQPHDAPVSAGTTDLHLFDHASSDLSDGPVIDLSDSPQIADDDRSPKFDDDLAPKFDAADDDLAPSLDLHDDELSPSLDMSDEDSAPKFDMDDEDTLQASSPLRDAQPDLTESLDSADQDTEVEKPAAGSSTESSFDFDSPTLAFEKGAFETAAFEKGAFETPARETAAFDMSAANNDEDSPHVDAENFGEDLDAEHANEFGAEHEHDDEPVELSGFGDESDEVPSLDMPDEEGADMALAGAPHNDATSDANELPAEPRPAKRKPSMLAGLIIMSTSVPVAAIVAYAVLLWGAGMDPIGLAPKLPAILVPKALANPPSAAPRQVAQATPGANANPNAGNEDLPGFNSNVPALTPRTDGTKPVDPTATPKTGAAAPDDDSEDAADDTAEDPAVKPAAADEPADDSMADDEPADEPAAVAKPPKKGKPAVAADDAMDDEPGDDLATEPAADDTAMDDEPAVKNPKKGKPAAADDVVDDEPADDLAADPADKPAADDTAMDDEPAEATEPADKPAADDTAMDDEPAETTPDAATPDDDAELATQDPAKVPGSDIAAPEAAVGPRDSAHYTADDVEKGLTEAQNAGTALAAADKDGLKKAKAQYYRKLYQLAELATFSESAPADSAGDSAKIQGLVDEVAADPARFSEVGKAAGRWITVSKGKEHQGVMLSGAVQSIAKQGQVYETKILLTDGKQVVSVLSAQKLPVAEGDQAVVIGSIVSDPASTIDGYEGTEETAVWSGMAVKASAG